MSCAHNVLAHNQTCSIEHCASCDALHITVGPITVRLQPDIAELLEQALGQALTQLPAGRPFGLSSTNNRLVS